MTQTSIITIDGQEYDAATGLRVSHDTPAAKPIAATTVRAVATATNLHSTPMRSKTLYRKATKRPSGQRTAIVGHDIKPAGQKVALTHPSVRKFAPHPVGAITPRKSMDIGPITHPHVAKAHALSAAKAQPLTSTLPTAKEIKDRAVKNAVTTSHKRMRLSGKFQPRQRAAAIISAVFALVLLGGYFTYLNMPALSVRVAAAQAGIDASYPSYRPDGYALAGPVTYSDGRVSMAFKANAGDQQFSVNQSKSSWDSAAVLDNYVSPRAGTSYIPYTMNGLTVYMYKNDAAWVNGGILYTIEGDAPLSSEQIRHIATSLL